MVTKIYIKSASFIERIVGLMFKEKITPFLIKTRFGIHTFFVRQEIDVVVLDKNNSVVKTKEGLKPWRFYFWNPKYSRILELPKGYIKNNKVKINSYCKLIEKQIAS